MSYIDKYALRGRPRIAPDAESMIEVQPQSISLRELSLFDKESRSIQAEIKRGKLRLDFSKTIGDKVLIKKKDAIKFANWILETYGNNKATNRSIPKRIRSTNK